MVNKKRSGVSTGVAAGLAVVLLIIGVVGGYFAGSAVPPVTSTVTSIRTSTVTQPTTVVSTTTVAAGTVTTTVTAGTATTTVTQPTTITHTATATVTTTATATQPPTTITTTVTAPAAARTYVIGVPLPFSGPLASYGKSFADAIAMAVDEINAMLQSAGSATRFEVATADTETTAAGALKAMQNLYQTKAIQVSVGPLTTSEVMGVKQFVDQNKIVVIAPASTGLAAAIPDDYIFRVVDPPDNFQGAALAQYVKSRGITNVIVAYRDDTFGQGMWNIFTKRFTALGGKTTPLKFAPDQPDYSSEVAKLTTLVAEAKASGPTGVLWVAWEGEALKWLPLLQGNPVLSSVEWFGIDNLKSPNLLPPKVSNEIGDFLVKTKFTVTSFYTPGNPLTPSFKENFVKKYGREPLPYSDGAYDAAYIAAWSILIAGKYDGEAIKKVVPTVASRFIGVTVQTYLDENGDQAIAYFGLYRPEVVQGAYSWVGVGYYDGSTDKVVIEKP
ncbi:MAG: penicillin-binding protein activator [Nitrososphaerales archaeon]